MKKIILITLLLITFSGSYAGSGNLHIINNTDFNLQITMYAQLPSCSTGCTYYVSNTFIFPNYSNTTYSLCGFSSTIGWTGVFSCPASWCSVSSGFNWTMAQVSLLPDCSATALVGDLAFCASSCSATGLGCFATNSVTWDTCATTPGTSMADVTITVN